MPRRRVNRRQQNTRQQCVDADRSTNSSNNSTTVWGHTDSAIIDSPDKPEKMQYDCQSYNEFPTLSPTNPTQCSIPVSSMSLSDDDGSTAPTAVADTDTGYSYFMFWKPQLPMVQKPQLPMIDDELAAALLNDHPTPVPRLSQPSSLSLPSGRAEVDRIVTGKDVGGKSEFNDFNYWRKPIVDVDLECLQF
jgi:hypothetical protein